MLSFLVYTYLVVLFDDILSFVSESLSSSKSIVMTSSKTTPRVWDFGAVLTGFIWAGKQKKKKKLADESTWLYIDTCMCFAHC